MNVAPPQHCGAVVTCWQFVHVDLLDRKWSIIQGKNYVVIVFLMAEARVEAADELFSVLVSWFALRFRLSWLGGEGGYGMNRIYMAHRKCWGHVRVIMMRSRPFFIIVCVYSVHVWSIYCPRYCPSIFEENTKILRFTSMNRDYSKATLEHWLSGW